SSTMRPPPPSSAVPSTTLFRSRAARASVLATDIDTQVLSRARAGIYAAERVARMEPARLKRFFLRGRGANEGQVRVRGELARMRSEEHTSELQSRENLVCRLLL